MVSPKVRQPIVLVVLGLACLLSPSLSAHEIPSDARVQMFVRPEGRTLRDLQLRSLTGAVVLAITRGDENVLLPVGRERLLAGDVLALAGTADALRDATALLGGAVQPHRGSPASPH